MTAPNAEYVPQTMRAGGSLYGYASAELLPHVRSRHDLFAVEWTEEQHLDAHAKGADHQHHYTETGALALTIKRAHIDRSETENG